MDIRFCDICNESVAQIHFDEGRAALKDGCVVVASSTQEIRGAGRPARPAGRGGMGSEWMAAAAIVVATGLGWIALDRAERGEADMQRMVSEERARLVTTLGAFSGGLSDLEQRGDADRQRVFAELDSMRGESSGGRVRVEELAASWQAQLAVLAEQIATLRDSAERGDSERLARIETGLAGLRGDVELLGGAMIDVLDGMPLATSADAPSHGAAGLDGAPAPAWTAALAGLTSADAMTRWDAVDQLARSGDAAAAGPLLPYLSDPDLVVRMGVARALADLGNPMAVPALIGALEDPEPPVREAAVVALRQLTGRSFRYDPAASESDRARKVESWQRWWERADPNELSAP